MNQGKPTKPKTLGPVSASFIDVLHKQSKTIFTLDDAEFVYGKSRQQTSKFIQQLVQRGILAKLKSGVYLILQSGQENVQLTNWPIIARDLVGKNQYFISYYSAMRLHGMTTHPLLDVYMSVHKRIRAKKISGLTYHFIYSEKKHFWGAIHYWASKQEQVVISDVERTILDGFDRPDLCGGLKEVIRGINFIKGKMNMPKLIKYALKFRSKAAIKRLGFVLEILDTHPDYVEKLNKIVADHKDYILLDPEGVKEGKYLSRWHIQINMNINELKEGVWG